MGKEQIRTYLVLSNSGSEPSFLREPFDETNLAPVGSTPNIGNGRLTYVMCWSLRGFGKVVFGEG
jgi:hypothetical protein